MRNRVRERERKTAKLGVKRGKASKREKDL